RSRATLFGDMAAFNIAFPVLTGDGEPERVQGSIVTTNLFGLLGVRPALGADFAPEQGQAGRHRVVMLSDELWRRRYGADPGVVGREIFINEQPYAVVGVMPSGYRHPDPSYQDGTLLWMPIAMDANASQRGGRYLRVMGRLRDDVTVERAREEMNAIARSLEQTFPATNGGYGVTLVPLMSQLFGDARPGLLLLFAATGAMLLIVCTNVANLTLARGLRRTREFAVRAALGSGRRRLVRQVLLESMTIALLGCGLGLLLLLFSTSLLQAGMRRYVSPLADIGIDPVVVAFALLLSTITALLFGVAPALRAARADMRSLMGAGRGSSAGRGSRRARKALIVGEVALTTALVVAAALLLRSFVSLVNVDPGLRVDRVLTFEVNLPASRYPDRAASASFYDQLLARLRTMPGVSDATLASNLPFTTLNNFIDFRVQESAPVGPPPQAEFEAVAPGYFDALGVPLLAGRDLSATDPGAGVESIVVNRTFAAKYWPGRDALGRRIALEGRPQETIGEVIGIVDDVLDDGLDASPEPMIYRSYLRAGSRWMTVLLSSLSEPASLVPRVRQEVAALDGTVPISNVTTLESIIADTLSTRRAVMFVTAIFAALALLAAAVGIYGVLAYMVGERAREIGIRAALGAAPRDVIRLVLGESLQMVGLGLAGGLMLALATTRLLSSLLFGISPRDPLTFVVVSAVLLGVATLASFRPVWRATRVDPMRVLREI
ncbi:MAG: ABC transporter permease, partial [Longimicrobiales bacterium]